MIHKLSCSLVGQHRKVLITPGTEAHRIYGKDEETEVFACNYGLNDEFQAQIRSRGLQASGYDEDGSLRIVELPGHRFFMGTLFVPQMTSEAGRPHPLVVAYLQAASG